MKIECLRDNLLHAVLQAERITGKNLALPILSTILMEAKNNQLFVRATNLDLGIEILVRAKSVKDGKVSIKGGVLSGFMANLKNDKKIILDKEGDILFVSSENTKAQLKTFNIDEFPSIPTAPKEQSLIITSNNLTNGLKSVWYSASNSHVKPELGSVLVYSEGEYLVFAATDSFRLAEKKIRLKKAKEISQILIPLKNVGEIIRVMEENPDLEVEIKLDKNQASFSVGDTYLVSRIMEGAFPDYKQILPKEKATEVIVLKEDIINSLKTATIFSNSFNQVVFNIMPSKKLFEIRAKNTEVGENTTFVPGAFEGEALEISFNHRYLLDCFQSLSADSVSFSFNGGNKPTVIKGVSDHSFIYLVMPMNK